MRLFVQLAAEQDILRQVEWYAEKGLPHIARRFHAAVLDAIDALQAMPGAGPPKFFDNPLLAGLRSWSVKGFDGEDRSDWEAAQRMTQEEVERLADEDDGPLPEGWESTVIVGPSPRTMPKPR